MLDTYNSVTQNVAVNSNLTFNTDRIDRGGATSHEAGSDIIKLLAPGTYEVSFNGIATATAAATAPIIVQLYGNDVAIPGGIASELSESTTDFVNLSFSVLVDVYPSYYYVNNTVSLSIRNVGIAANFNNANVVVTKVR